MSEPTHIHWPGQQSIHEREQLVLAPYALHSNQSRGRKHPEPEHPYRGPFQRDRDRIVHCAAFRRLSDKTQVFTGWSDYHRTRLTHTMEVASIARTIGRTLRLNEDMVEGLALLHDIGHPPFGHAGEEALDECLSDVGGFSHNRFALTIVEELEIRYTAFSGLNLTREILEGQASRIDKSAGRSSPFLESQAVDAADSITYNAHDTDDAIKLGLVSLEEMLEVPLVRRCADRVIDRCGSIEGELLRKAIVHELIDFLVGDVLVHTGRRLAEATPTSVDQVSRYGFRVLASPALAAEKTELERFLYERVYRHEQLVRVRSQAQQWLKTMFEQLCLAPERMPPAHRDRIPSKGLRRAVGEYLAGMTDRYCMDLYRRRFAPSGGSGTVRPYYNAD